MQKFNLSIQELARILTALMISISNNNYFSIDKIKKFELNNSDCSLDFICLKISVLILSIQLIFSAIY